MTNYAAVQRLALPIIHAENDHDFKQLAALVLDADVIVDALLGTGVSRSIGGALAGLLAVVRQSIDQRAAEQKGQIYTERRGCPGLAASG